MSMYDTNDNEVEVLVNQLEHADEVSRNAIKERISSLLVPVVDRVLRGRLGHRLQDEVSLLTTQAIARTLTMLEKRRPLNLAAYAGGVAKRLAIATHTADRGGDRELASAANTLRPYIDEERELRESGTLPEGWERLPLPERVRRLYRRKLDARFAPAVAWWNQQVQALCPDNPFAVKDAKSFLKARRLFTEGGIDPAQWREPSGQYYVPKEAIHPYGIRLVSRLIESMNRHDIQAEYAIDVRSSSSDPDYSAPWIATLSSRPRVVFARVANELFARPGYELEYAVAQLMAAPREQPRQEATLRPCPQEITRYLAKMPPEIAAEIRECGWTKIVREIEAKVAAHLSEPGVGQRLAMQLNVAA